MQWVVVVLRHPERVHSNPHSSVIRADRDWHVVADVEVVVAVVPVLRPVASDWTCTKWVDTVVAVVPPAVVVHTEVVVPWVDN